MKLLKGFELLALGAAIAHNGNGTGGSAPAIRHYVAINGEENVNQIGHGPHAIDGIVTKDGGYIAVGSSTPTETSQISRGYVARINPCENPQSYSYQYGSLVQGAGNNCAQNFKWAWKQTTSNRRTAMVSVKESSDGAFLIAVGTRQKTSQNTKYNGYVAKLNAATGALVWDFDFTTNSGTRSGFETVSFTEDGGFIVGGFTHKFDTNFPTFKSGGQVEDARPVMHKFSKETFDKTQMNGAPTPAWTYNCKTQSGIACQLEDGSMKNMRVYKDGNVEKVVAVPTPRSVLVIVNANTGAEIAFSGDGHTNGFVGDGTANDVEVDFDANGNVSGFVTSGLLSSSIQTDGGVNCGNDGCSVIVGTITKYKPDLTGKIWRTDLETGLWPGGQVAPFVGTAVPTYKSLIYTECWGLAKQFDGTNNHIGYVAACGSGVEPECGHHPNAIKPVCQSEPRMQWRHAVASVNRGGNLRWYRLDSFSYQAGQSSESASEYIMVTNEGRVVSLADEGMGGFGFLTYECEEGITCSDGTVQTTTTVTEPPVTDPPVTDPPVTDPPVTDPPVTNGPVTTNPIDPEPPTCIDMKWKGKKATKLMYRGKTDGKRSYILRQTILNNSVHHPNIRQDPYVGFFMFARKYCGVDFFNALSDGTIKLGMYDYESTYDVQYKHARISGSKGSSVTFQYKQNTVGQKDAPWTKKNGNSNKKDQFFLTISGVPDSFDSAKETSCFNLLTGVLPNGSDMNADWTECASTQKDAGF